MRKILFLVSVVSLISLCAAVTFFRGRPRTGMLHATKIDRTHQPLKYRQRLGATRFSSKLSNSKLQTKQDNAGFKRKVQINPADVKTLWLQQRLDHFNEADNRMWSQKWFLYDGLWKRPDGPVFLMLGGEGPATADWFAGAQWCEIFGAEFGALCLQIEHRYYGDSHPTANMSTESLVWLSSRQALADAAYLHHVVTEQYQLSDANKWVVFGGSYSGSLAAWARLKYPHLFAAAVGSSAPLRAVVDFSAYLDVVTASLSQVTPKCVDAVAAATRQLEAAILNQDSSLTSLFSLCSPLNFSEQLDVENLYSTLSGNVEDVVQYNRDNRQSAIRQNTTIDLICNGFMLNEDLGDELHRYAAFNNFYQLKVLNETCTDYTYTSFINQLRNESWNAGEAGGRAWTYQTCTEFGYFQSTDSDSQPFGKHFPVDFFVRQCADVFGPQFTGKLLDDAIVQTNIEYGSLQLASSRILLPNGSIDPWHALGITQDVSSDLLALYIEGTAHCADMYPSSDRDSEALRNARFFIQKQIGVWLGK